MGTTRTLESQQKYDEYLKTLRPEDGCPFCTKPALKTFKYWKITENSFPWDTIATTHHLLMPLRHVKGDDLTQEELKELEEIKITDVHSVYEYILECTNKEKTIPEHFHLHLMIWK